MTLHYYLNAKLLRFLLTALFCYPLVAGLQAQVASQEKLEGYYKINRFDKCDQLCAKIEKKSIDPREKSIAHLYASLCNLGFLVDETFDAYDNKNPLKIATEQIVKFYKTADDSLLADNDSLARGVIRKIETAIINHLEMGKYKDAQTVVDEMVEIDSTNIGAKLCVDLCALAQDTKGDYVAQYEGILESGKNLSAANQTFLTEVAVIYAAWFTKNGKSDLAKTLATKTITLVGENKLLSVF